MGQEALAGRSISLLHDGPADFLQTGGPLCPAGVVRVARRDGPRRPQRAEICLVECLLAPLQVLGFPLAVLSPQTLPLTLGGEGVWRGAI